MRHMHHGRVTYLFGVLLQTDLLKFAGLTCISFLCVVLLILIIKVNTIYMFIRIPVMFLYEVIIKFYKKKQVVTQCFI